MTVGANKDYVTVMVVVMANVNCSLDWFPSCTSDNFTVSLEMVMAKLVVHDYVTRWQALVVGTNQE